jgi:hypothetical protein
MKTRMNRILTMAALVAFLAGAGNAFAVVEVIYGSGGQTEQTNPDGTKIKITCPNAASSVCATKSGSIIGGQYDMTVYYDGGGSDHWVGTDVVPVPFGWEFVVVP